jgi:hypothetical protein
MLEDDFECWLLNAHHLKNVPGRKTDVKDAEWICCLVEHGLVRPSFVPPKEIRELRNLTRYRKAQIEERTREVQSAWIRCSRMQPSSFPRSLRACWGLRGERCSMRSSKGPRTPRDLGGVGPG